LRVYSLSEAMSPCSSLGVYPATSDGLSETNAADKSHDGLRNKRRSHKNEQKIDIDYCFYRQNQEG
jgi:hypothetical protein